MWIPTPRGATVTVDGNVVGTTLLAAQPITAGTHEIVIAEPTYLPVTQRQQGRAPTMVGALAFFGCYVLLALRG